jgi:hypothetical protein
MKVQINLLIYFGGDPLAVNRTKQTPFDRACQMGCVRVSRSSTHERVFESALKLANPQNGFPNKQQTAGMRPTARQQHGARVGVVTRWHWQRIVVVHARTALGRRRQSHTHYRATICARMHAT